MIVKELITIIKIFSIQNIDDRPIFLSNILFKSLFDLQIEWKSTFRVSIF